MTAAACSGLLWRRSNTDRVPCAPSTHVSPRSREFTNLLHNLHAAITLRVHTQFVTQVPAQLPMTTPEPTAPLEHLLRALEHGWRVQSPVYGRRIWFTAEDTRDGYYFILKRGAETDLAVVTADDQARQFIRLQHLNVIAT